MKKCVYTRKVNAVKFSPDARNGLGGMQKLIKEHILETLGWFKIIRKIISTQFAIYEKKKLHWFFFYKKDYSSVTFALCLD